MFFRLFDRYADPKNMAALENALRRAGLPEG
jgi:hypothetical protein